MVGGLYRKVKAYIKSILAIYLHTSESRFTTQVSQFSEVITAMVTRDSGCFI